AGGFLACHRFVTHITGFATHFGAEVSKGQLFPALGVLAVPFFFLLGTMISAFFTDRRTQKNQKPLYSVVLTISTAVLGIVAVFGTIGWFGEFGEPLILSRDYILLALLCLTAGLQNAVITSASGAVVRTTHLTGITTDLGIGIVRVLNGPKDSPHRTLENKANLLRVGLIFYFIVGSAIGAFAFTAFQYLGFTLPLALNFLLLVGTLKYERTQGTGFTF
ncbi:MAG: YoaK family protein, partial [Pseudobdellovibrionaceae bacterium]